jgi:hypothetical protein
MTQQSNNSGDLLLIGLGLVSLPYIIVRHPIKTYNLVFHKIGWYD